LFPLPRVIGSYGLSFLFPFFRDIQLLLTAEPHSFPFLFLGAKARACTRKKSTEPARGDDGLVAGPCLFLTKGDRLVVLASPRWKGDRKAPSPTTFRIVACYLLTWSRTEYFQDLRNSRLFHTGAPALLRLKVMTLARISLFFSPIGHSPPLRGPRFAQIRGRSCLDLIRKFARAMRTLQILAHELKLFTRTLKLVSAFSPHSPFRFYERPYLQQLFLEERFE